MTELVTSYSKQLISPQEKLSTWKIGKLSSSVKSKLAKYNVQKIHSKAVLLLITWIFFYILYLNFMIYFFRALEEEYQDRVGTSLFFLPFIVASLAIVYPLVGWITDTYTGRYRAIIFGCYASMVSCVSACLTYLIFRYTSSTISGLILAYTTITIVAIGCGPVTANLIQFMTDQILESSNEEVSASIYWHFWAGNLALFLERLVTCQLPDIPLFVLIILAFLSTLIILVSNYVCYKWLDKTTHIKNTIKTILQVLNYARKNTISRNRSPFTYLDELQPSRIDLSKDIYGGPYKEQDVEDVKTVLRLLPILIYTLAIGIPHEHRNRVPFHLTNVSNIKSCTLLYISNSLPGVLAIPFYHFILYPCLYKYIPRMLRRIGIGIAVTLLGALVYMCIDGIGHWKNSEVVCMFNDFVNKTDDTNVSEVLPIDNRWILIPQGLYGVGNIILLTTGTEFLIAQSPQTMKGLLIGLNFAVIGFGYVFSSLLFHPFTYAQAIKPSCGFYYYLSKSTILLFILLLYVCLSKWYKLRQRENIINLPYIIAEHHERYINMKNEFDYKVRSHNDTTTLKSTTNDSDVLTFEESTS